jgi:hypothetical protein
VVQLQAQVLRGLLRRPVRVGELGARGAQGHPAARGASSRGRQMRGPGSRAPAASCTGPASARPGQPSACRSMCYS